MARFQERMLQALPPAGIMLIVFSRFDSDRLPPPRDEICCDPVAPPGERVEFCLYNTTNEACSGMHYDPLHATLAPSCRPSRGADGDDAGDTAGAWRTCDLHSGRLRMLATTKDVVAAPRAAQLRAHLVALFPSMPKEVVDRYAQVLTSFFGKWYPVVASVWRGNREGFLEWYCVASRIRHGQKLAAGELCEADAFYLACRTVIPPLLAHVYGSLPAMSKRPTVFRGLAFRTTEELGGYIQSMPARLTTFVMESCSRDVARALVFTATSAGNSELHARRSVGKLGYPPLIHRARLLCVFIGFDCLDVSDWSPITLHEEEVWIRGECSSHVCSSCDLSELEQYFEDAQVQALVTDAPARRRIIAEARSGTVTVSVFAASHVDTRHIKLSDVIARREREEALERERMRPLATRSEQRQTCAESPHGQWPPGVQSQEGDAEGQHEDSSSSTSSTGNQRSPRGACGKTNSSHYKLL